MIERAISRQRNRIPAPHSPATNNSRVNADISLVVLHDRAKDIGVFGKHSLGQRGHDATERGPGHEHADLAAEQDGPADPVVLDESVSRPAHSMTKFGRKRATSKRLFGASSASRSSVAVVTRWIGAPSKKVPAGNSNSKTFVGLLEPVVIRPVTLGAGGRRCGISQPDGAAESIG